MAHAPGGDLLSRIRSVPLFRALSDDPLRELAGRLATREVRRGEVIFRRGDQGTTLYVIDAGAVRISNLATDGREAVVALLGPGEVFGELSLFGQGLRSADAHAMEDGRLLSLSHEDFRPYLEQHAAVAVALLDILASRLRETDEALQDVIFQDVPGRVAKRLCQLAANHGVSLEDGVLIDLTLTQEDLARMVGSSRETVNKALTAFTARGWIRSIDRRYVITDQPALTQRAEA
jgi:CRP-like cAMP-binding protein